MAADRLVSWFHGCWLEPGHFLFTEDGGWSKASPFATWNHGGLDGGYAPRRVTRRRGINISGVTAAPGGIVFTRMFAGDSETDREARNDIDDRSEELEQGRFLFHQNVLGCSLISWWDRTQGDGRGACNSTFIVNAVLPDDPARMVELFTERFPIQAKRLADAGVQLVCVNDEMERTRTS